jgi:uncharacterized protein YdhG (YjbR/CyaY superfamily)
MEATKTKFETVDQYMDSISQSARQTLEKIRATIGAAAPEGKEIIHYQMPAIEYKGDVIIYFAAFKNHYHITIPRAGKIFEAFKGEFSPLDISKSTIRLPMDEPVPLDLIKRVTQFRIAELK